MGRRQRIEKIMEVLKLTKNQLAMTCGIDPSNLSKMLLGDQKITDKTLNKIITGLPQVNEEWLLTGDGEMLNHDISETKSRERDLTWVPLINIDSVGGMSHRNLITSGEQYAERLIPFTEAREGDVAIYQSGDSMNPGIPSGSILLIRNVPDWREYFGYGDVFVLWLKDDRRLTKQIKKYSPDPGNYVTCHSFNPDFGDEELPKKYIREVWKVIKVLADKGW